jgi:3-oxoacyl-[acyl-carrier-protein] synthase-3
MHGRNVFTHAVRRMSASTEAVLANVGWAKNDLDWLVGHQANLRILRTLADHLGIARERAVVHLDRVGNTSAASIPLALADAVERGAFAVGDRMLLTAFGGGLTWGSVALTWPPLSVAATVVPAQRQRAAALEGELR